MRANLEFDNCAKCGERKGEVPIFDEGGNNYWICEYCDSDMEWETISITKLKEEKEWELN